MDISRIDLNLLRVLHRLLQDRHVSQAALALGLSQPAVSNALRRLRQLLGDELLVRTGAGMRPTPYAERLAQPIAQALSLIDGALRAEPAFDPALSERRFTIAMSDVGEIYFLPVLMRALAQAAPRVTLRTVSTAGSALGQGMATGQIDLALGSLPTLQAGFYQQGLFHQTYVCLMRRAHPATLNAWSRAAFLALDHVHVEAPGTGHGQLDTELARKGLQRRIRLAVPNYVALGHVLSSTDLVATVPERFAERVVAPLDLLVRPLPVRIARTGIHQFWHASTHRDRAHRWLRALIAATFGDNAATAPVDPAA